VRTRGATINRGTVYHGTFMPLFDFRYTIVFCTALRYMYCKSGFFLTVQIGSKFIL
jgi:hypothetical protein